MHTRKILGQNLSTKVETPSECFMWYLAADVLLNTEDGNRTYVTVSEGRAFDEDFYTYTCSIQLYTVFEYYM